jgi:hypothetical protein
MTSDVIVEDWLWEDDSPEEPEEYEPSYEERMLRRRAWTLFIGSIIGLLALAILGVVSYRIISDQPVKQLPSACVGGKLDRCPERPGGGADSGKGSKSGLPGGFDPTTGESKGDSGSGSGISRRKIENRRARCLRGEIEFCG